MYLKWTSEFIKFIADRDHTVEEVLAHLVLRVMAPLGASSAFISTLDNQNTLSMVGRFGIPDEISGEYKDKFSMNDHLPITDAVRLRKIIVINTLPIWPPEYAALLDAPYASAEPSFIAFPIERSGTPVAVAAIFFNTKIKMSAQVELFIGSIANLLAMYLYHKIDSPAISNGNGHNLKTSHSSELGLELTQRQLLILRMISEGRTNIAIGDLLKYSESTIRQETIKIFSKLGCNGRDEASTLYKQEQSKVQAVS